MEYNCRIKKIEKDKIVLTQKNQMQSCGSCNSCSKAVGASHCEFILEASKISDPNIDDIVRIEANERSDKKSIGIMFLIFLLPILVGVVSQIICLYIGVEFFISIFVFLIAFFVSFFILFFVDKKLHAIQIEVLEHIKTKL